MRRRHSLYAAAIVLIGTCMWCLPVGTRYTAAPRVTAHRPPRRLAQSKAPGAFDVSFPVEHYFLPQIPDADWQAPGLRDHPGCWQYQGLDWLALW